MSPQMLENAFNGAKQLYESGDLSKDDYLNSLKSLDAGKINESTEENVIKKQQLSTLISNEIVVVSAAA
jgi:hypothetical protein